MKGSIPFPVNGAARRRNKKPLLVNDCGGCINDLPEHVLTHIISFLPIKDAVRTSVLSKDWEYKWTSLYKIDIGDRQKYSNRKAKKTNFVNFVDRVLFLSQNIKSFSLSCEQEYDPRHVKRWISALSRRGVQSIDILSTYDEFILPRSLFYSTSLTKLKLSLRCTIKVPVGNYFSNLTLLFLSEVIFKNEDNSNPRRLILTFPVLESLELGFCTWLNVRFVEINSPALTSFQYMCNYYQRRNYVIKICGARLEKFEIGGCQLKDFDLMNASSIVYASIDCSVGHPFIGILGGLSLKEFSGLKHLSLQGSIMKAHAELKPGLPLPIFDKLESLVFDIYRGSTSIEALLELLHTMPILKLLILNLNKFSEAYDFMDYNYDDVGSMPSCTLSYLKEIKFYYFAGTAPQVHLAKFLLKNSMKLEEIFISICKKPLIPKVKIERLFSTSLKGSACVSIVVT